MLLSAQELATRVAELGRDIAADYAGRRPVLVGILNGCFPFMADLVRAIDIHVEVDFMRVASYGVGTASSGEVRILKDVDMPIEGRHVIVVEDIIDTGLTLQHLIDHLGSRGPASIELCTLLDKHEARTVEVAVKYVGFRCPNEFLVGYGLDRAGLFRNLPYVAVVSTNDA